MTFLLIKTKETGLSVLTNEITSAVFTGFVIILFMKQQNRTIERYKR
jgi:hypothetical protein